jgi:hypothetical protein
MTNPRPETASDLLGQDQHRLTVCGLSPILGQCNDVGLHSIATGMTSQSISPDTVEGLQEVAIYLQDEIKRSMAFSAHREAMRATLIVIRREILRKKKPVR